MRLQVVARRWNSETGQVEEWTVMDGDVEQLPRDRWLLSIDGMEHGMGILATGDAVVDLRLVSEVHAAAQEP